MRNPNPGKAQRIKSDRPEKITGLKDNANYEFAGMNAKQTVNKRKASW